jgi:hypothetical protein
MYEPIAQKSFVTRRAPTMSSFKPILCQHAVAPVTLGRRFRAFGTTWQTRKSSMVCEK